MGRDADQLRLLSVFHYVVGGMMALFSMFPVIHLSVGIAIVCGAFDDPDQGDQLPALFGWFFIIIPLVFIISGLILATCILVAGRKLSRRSSYMYCLVIAALECMIMPFGTVLGVFTIVVLMRPNVRKLFGIVEDGDEDSENAICS
jgi:hypothetical protein